MRKLTILGLSLLLSVGAFAQAQLPSAKAQKLSASAMKAEQTASLSVKVLGTERTRSASTSNSQFVVQNTGTTKALIPSKARSKAKATVKSTNIYAGMIYPEELLGGGKIDPATGTFTQIYKISAGVHSIGVNPDLGEIYSIEYNQDNQGQFFIAGLRYAAYDMTTGSLKREVPVTTEDVLMDLPQRGAYVPDENAFYGYSASGWVKVDCASFTSTKLSDQDAFPFGLTYNSNTQQLVAMVHTTAGFGIATVDKATGAIGNPTMLQGVDSDYLGGFGYDYNSDSYLFNPNSDYLSEIISIDATTFAVTTICEIPDAAETACIYVNEVKPKDPLAPQAPEFVSATFTDGSLSGTVTFTLPTQNASMEDLTGNLTYTIKAGDEVIASDTAAPGAQVSASYTASASGEVTFTCIASQDTHVSKGAAKTVYIGIDTPAAPANVTLSPTTVTWDAVTTGIHDGYIDLSKVTYTVSINNQVVADGIKDTSCRTNLPVNAELKNYVAKVTATADGLTGPAASSNDIAFGQPLNEPVSLAPSAQQAKLFTLINNNDDTQEWTYDESEKAFRLQYNSDMASDDYIVLPPVLISDIGKFHKFSFDAWVEGMSIWGMTFTFPEKLEVWIGREPTAEGLTTMVMSTENFENTAEDKLHSECVFQVPSAGKWYVAVKCVSDDGYLVWANNFALEASDIATNGPAAVENVEAIPGAEGALKATVKFNMPTKDNLGNALNGDVTVTIKDDVDLKTVTGAVGSAQTVEITTVQGNNDITIRAAQGAVLGYPTVVTVYTGVEAPGAVNNMVLTASENGYGVYGKFDAPDEGADGGYIRQDGLTYALYVYDGSAWGKLLDLGKTMEFQTTDLLPEGTAQDSYRLGIAATNEAGTGLIYYTSVTIGAPFEMPIIEDYATGSVTYQPLMLNTQGGMKQSYLTAAGLNKLNPAFGEKGSAIVGQATTDGQFGYFFLPMMSTKGANKAAFEISYYKGACENVTVYAEAFGVERTEIFNESYLSGYPDGFQDMPIELPAQFQDKEWVKITIRCDFSAAKKYFIWNGYKLINMVPKDMVAVDVKAPKKVATGTEYNVTVDVANYGLSVATDYTVELYANGEKVAEKAGAELASYAEGQVVFTQTMSPIATEDIDYSAKVVQTGDANTANNETAVVTVSPMQSNLPGATELTAADSENAVALTWNEPDLTAVIPEPVTDDFEDANAFAAEYGDWVFVDLDEENVGGFQDTDIPGITPGETKGSFWIWDQSQLGNQSFQAHSGTKYLFSLFSYQDNQVDDWAISPQLYGDEQTVSFWARSYSAQYPEKIAVYYSTGSTDPKDFVLIEGSKVDAVPAEWTEYSVDLPQGATRFAIRSYAAGSFMLMVDDVTYTPAAAFTGEISLKGYDVYRDGVKLNDAPVENTAYADSNVVKGTEYKYVVVALFDEGTGRVSNTASIVYGQSGLDELGAAKSIATARNTIIVRGFAGEKVIVSSADGKVIANGEASEISSISVPAGVYVVKAGNKSVKVVVK